MQKNGGKTLYQDNNKISNNKQQKEQIRSIHP